MLTTIWRRWKFLLNLQLLTLIPTESCREICHKNMRAYIRTTIWRQEVIQTVLWRWIEDCRKRTIFHHNWHRWTRAEWYVRAESIRCLLTIWDLEQEAGFLRIRKLAQFVHHEDRYSIEIHVRSLFQDRTASWASKYEWSWKVRKRNDRNHWRRRA